MPNAVHDPAQLLAECLRIAESESGALVQRTAAAAFRTLVQASNNAGSGGERSRLADAAEALHRATGVVAQAYPGLLAEEMRTTDSGPRAKSFSFDSLELMAEDQVDDTVELVRGQQAVQDAVESQLVQLNALVSALQGHDLVQAASNPLRPQAWVKALHRSLAKGSGSAATRSLWMQHLCAPFGPELGAIYQRICDHILAQGIAAAAYRVAPSKHETRRRAEAVQFTLRDLKRLLVNASRDEGDTQGLTRPAGDTLNGLTMPAAMVALEGMKKVDDVVRRMQERWRSGVWHAESAQDADSTVAEYTPTQTLAREVVREMVGNIASDERLLPDIQHLVRKLEPALLDLVLYDQRFFTEKRHPARELLEEVTQRSLAWSRQNAAGFAEFISLLDETVEALVQVRPHDAEPFDFALQTLRQSWAEEEERTRRQRASAARALMKADERNHAASAIAEKLRARPDVASAPPEVRRFVLGPWCQVIAAARLAAPAAQDPGGCEMLVNDIIWSSQPRLASQNPAKLQRLMGTLVPQLRDMLAGIGATGRDVQAFLTDLESAHARALRGELHDAPAAAPKDAAASGIDWDAGALPWLTPEEVQDSKLMPPPEFESTRREEPVGGTSPDFVPLLVGEYVEVQVRGSWARWKLAWTSPHGTMLMFTDAGGRPESMPVSAWSNLVASGGARRVSAGSVVDNALDAVAQTALENSSYQPPV